MKKYYIWPIGCAQNISDAERVAAVLENLGYAFTQDEKEADIICALACSVRQTAIDRIHGRAKNWRKFDHKPLKILSGCVLPKDKKKMNEIFDIFFEIKDLAELPVLIRQNHPEKSEGSQARIGRGGDSSASPQNEKIKTNYFNYLSIRPKHKSNFQALIPISNGCDNFCSYCAVPHTRGRETSRPSAEIVNEIKELVEKGYKEITLLGQNVNSYGKSKTDIQKGLKEITFFELLKRINEIPGDFWIRFYSNHPKDFSEELIEGLKNLKKINPAIHLPLQSGSYKILRAMNRKYTAKKYLDLVKKIRENNPEITLETDAIVGFPGESLEDYKQTVEVFKQAKFDMAYIAKYSPRPGTLSAARMKDDVPKEEKVRRFKDLTEVLSETALENNQKYLDKEVEVLIEKSHKGFLWGQTKTFKNVKILQGQSLQKKKSSEELIGTFQKVRIQKVSAWILTGKL